MYVLTKLMAVTFFLWTFQIFGQEKDLFKIQVQEIDKNMLGSYEGEISAPTGQDIGPYNFYGYHIDDYITSIGGRPSCTEIITTISYHYSPTVLFLKEGLITEGNLFDELNKLTTKKEKIDLIKNIASLSLESELYVFEKDYNQEQRKIILMDQMPLAINAIIEILNIPGVITLESFSSFLDKKRENTKKKIKDFTQSENNHPLSSRIKSLIIGLGGCFPGGKILSFTHFEKKDMNRIIEISNNKYQHSKEKKKIKYINATPIRNIGFHTEEININDLIKLNSSIYFIHRQVPLINPFNPTSQILGRDENEVKEYKKHDHLLQHSWKINSIISRIVMKRNKKESFFILLSRTDSKKMAIIGFILEITPLNEFKVLKDSKTFLRFNTIHFNRGSLKDSFSLILENKGKYQEKAYSIYIGMKSSEKKSFSTSGPSSHDYQEYFLGAQGEIWKEKFFSEKLSAALTSYIKITSHNSNSSSKDTFEGHNVEAGLFFKLSLSERE